MGFLTLYAIFAISVGLFACYEVMAPAIRLLKKSGKHGDVILENKFLAYLVMFCVGALVAPLMFYFILVPETNSILVENIVFRNE